MLPQMLANEFGAGHQRMKDLAQLSCSSRCGAHHQRTICDGICDGFVFLRSSQQARCPDRRARFTKSYVVRLHYPEMLKSEIGHDAGGRANIERVACGDQYNAQVVEFAGAQQMPILRMDRFERSKKAFTAEYAEDAEES